MTEVADKTHALLSPSGAHRWTRCPGSVVLEQGTEDKSSVHARWGTACHEVAALILAETLTLFAPTEIPCQRWEPENAESFVGRNFVIDGHDVEFDMEMADCVNDYVAHVESYWSPGDIMLVEQAVPLEQITGENDATGTSDCIIIKPRDAEIVVIDLKGGRGVQVEAEENEQGLMYADGAATEHDLVYGPFTRVRIVIIQPRLAHVSEWPLDWADFRERVEELRERAYVVDQAIKVDNGTLVGCDDWPVEFLNPGEKQCRFCSAKAICPALKGAVSEALSLTAPPARADEFPDLSIGKQAAAAAGDMADVDHDALAKAWKAIPLIEQWVGAVRDAVHAALHDGKEVGDLCLYEGKQGSRGWSDEDEAETLMKKARVKADEMYSKKLISYPAAEKALKGRPVWAKLAPLVDRADGKPVVGVKGDEKRSPWSPARPEEFPDLDASDLSADEDDIFA